MKTKKKKKKRENLSPEEKKRELILKLIIRHLEDNVTEVGVDPQVEHIHDGPLWGMKGLQSIFKPHNLTREDIGPYDFSEAWRRFHKKHSTSTRQIKTDQGESNTEADLSKSRKLQKAADAILEFLEEMNTPKNIPDIKLVSIADGYYEGLLDAIQFAGVKAKYVTIQAINLAWRMFHVKHPPIRRRIIEPEVTSQDPDQPEKEKKGKRTKLFGFNISSVLRRMGEEGFTYEDAKNIMQHYEIDCVDTTIKGQLWCGTQSVKKYGNRAELTDDQINTLFEVLKK